MGEGNGGSGLGGVDGERTQLPLSHFFLKTGLVTLWAGHFMCACVDSCPFLTDRVQG